MDIREVNCEDLAVCGLLQIGDIIRYKVQTPLETYVGKFEIIDVSIEQPSIDIGLVVCYTTQEIDYIYNPVPFYGEPVIRKFAARLTTIKQTTEEEISQETRNKFIKLLLE